MKYNETVIQKYYDAVKIDVLNMEGIYEELKDELKNPLDIFTYEMFFEGIKQFGVHISILPYEYFTPEICLEAVKPDTVRHMIYNDPMNKGSAIRWIPEEFITEEICLLAVQQNGYNLQYVPPKFKTKELCRLALYNELCGFEFIPEEFLTEEWCYIGAKAKYHCIINNILNEIPKKFRTERVCIEAVKRKGHELFFVHEALKTKELCLMAIKAICSVYKDIIEQIPADYWNDKDFCVQAVKENPFIIKRVPEKIRTMDFCLDAVKYNGECLANIPKKQKTEEVCFYAVKNTWGASQYVPEEMRKKVIRLTDKYNEYPSSSASGV